MRNAEVIAGTKRNSNLHFAKTSPIVRLQLRGDKSFESRKITEIISFKR